MASVDTLARKLDALGTAVRLGARSFTALDTNPVPADWRHVTKLDPEDEKLLPLLYPLYLRHTSAVSVGGSSDVTPQNTRETFELLRPLSTPAFHEPSEAAHVTEEAREDAAFIAIPEVLNGDSESLVGTLGVGTEYIREELTASMLGESLPRWTPVRVRDALSDFLTSWLLSQAVFEAYIIQNPDSAAAREANVAADDLLDPAEAKQHAMAAERHLGSEIIYVEYSGTYGGGEAADILAAIADGVEWSRIWYGGGLDSRERVREVLDAGADSVVVGDAFHDVAAEEVEICAAAVDDLPLDASVEQVRNWVDANVDVGAGSATRYLSTTPGVRDPETTARRYVVATIRTTLELERLAAAVSESNPTTRDGLRQAVSDYADAYPGERFLAPLGDDARALARTTALDVLGERFGIDDAVLPVSHLSATH